VWVRNAAFDHGVLPVYRPPVPVIAVGNLTVGGTGKTPMVGWILAYLRGRGVRPVVLSRGYGRRTKGVVVVADGTALLKDARDGGDEPVQLARSFPDVPVVVGERRADAAREALARFAPGVFLLDDAFQHRAIARDLDVVIVDGSRDLAAEGLLPAGRRREPLSALRRASVVVYTHLDPATGRVEGESTVGAWFDGPVVQCTRTIGSLAGSNGTPVAIPELKNERCVLVSGIGNPDRFERDCRALGAEVVDHLRFRDHYPYQAGDAAAIAASVRKHGARRIVTTEKDMVRLLAVPEAIAMLEALVPVTAAVLHVQVNPAGLLESRIDAVLGRVS
jgi:tetraacyldisaccharide 4'-kinase